jgi:hypothetical protein
MTISPLTIAIGDRLSMLRIGRSVAILASCALKALSAQSSPSCNDNATGPPVALVSSGGISKGAYQAGALWAFLQVERALRDSGPIAPIRLLSAVGASAGNVNSLLVPIEWARRSTPPEGEAGSLLWQVWTRVGVQDLLPSGADRNKDLTSLLSTSAFEGSIAALQKTERESLLPCRVAVAVSMTRADSVSLLRIPSVRDAAVLRHVSFVDFIANTSGWTLARRDTIPVLGGTGVPIEPPAGKNGTVALRDFVPHVLASAAFPGAFPPRRVAYRERRRDARVDTAVFLDGGVFDNEPIGVAKGLLEGKKQSSDSTKALCPNGIRPDDTCFVAFVSPNRLRARASLGGFAAGGEAPSGEQISIDTGEVAVSISQLFTFAGHLQRAAADAEIARLELPSANGAGACSDSSSTLKVCVAASSRLFPIFGATAGSFGAFLSRAMREHDFYVGVYDGLLATTANRFPPDPNEALPHCAVGSRIYRGERVVECLPGLSPVGKTFVARLFRSEHPHLSETDVSPSPPTSASPRLSVLLALAKSLDKASSDAREIESRSVQVREWGAELRKANVAPERRRELRSRIQRAEEERKSLSHSDCRSSAAVIVFVCGGGLLAAVYDFADWYKVQPKSFRGDIARFDPELDRLASAPLASIYNYAVEIALRARLLQDRELSLPLKFAGRFLEMALVKSRSERAREWWRPVYSTPGEPAERWGWGLVPPTTVTMYPGPTKGVSVEWMPLGAIFTKLGAAGPVLQAVSATRANIGVRYQSRLRWPVEVHNTVLVGAHDADREVVVRPHVMLLWRTIGVGPEWRVRRGDWGAPRMGIAINDLPALWRLVLSAPQ